MWGNIFDVTKELAEKARKAAEELERNLNDSAGIAPQPSTTVISEEPQQHPSNDNKEEEDEEDFSSNTNDNNNIAYMTTNDNNHNSNNEGDDDDDALNDAWDDDNMDTIDIDADDQYATMEDDAATADVANAAATTDATNIADTTNIGGCSENHPEQQQGTIDREEDGTTAGSNKHDVPKILTDSNFNNDDDNNNRDNQNSLDDTIPTASDLTITAITSKMNEPDVLVAAAAAAAEVIEAPTTTDTNIKDQGVMPLMRTVNNDSSKIEEHNTNNNDDDDDDRNEDHYNMAAKNIDVAATDDVVLRHSHDATTTPTTTTIVDVVVEHLDHDCSVSQKQNVDSENEVKVVVDNEKEQQQDKTNHTNIEREDEIRAAVVATTQQQQQEQQAQPQILLSDRISNQGMGLITSFFSGGGSSSSSTTTTNINAAAMTATNSTVSYVTDEGEIGQESIPNITQEENEEQILPVVEPPLPPQPEESQLEQYKNDIQNDPEASFNTTVPVDPVLDVVELDDDPKKMKNEQLPFVANNTTDDCNLHDDEQQQQQQQQPVALPNLPVNDDYDDATHKGRITTMSEAALPSIGAMVIDDDIVSIIDKIMANEDTRQLLEQKYLLVAGGTQSIGMNDNTKEIGPSTKQLQEELHHREQQLFSKTEQLALMETMYENEKQELLSKVQSTKEEAKRRIQKAKERVDAVELKLKNISTQQSGSAAVQNETIQQQATMITELRKEGEKLAQKQADMELVVRTSKAETRDLRTQITEMGEETNTLANKLSTLEVDYKAVQNELTLARQGISQVNQLDTELRTVREENEKRATTILTIEQTMKELKATNKEMEGELKEARKGAAKETEQERKRLIIEHGQIVSDIEMKLQATVREAAIREDALRVEIDDLRKRWQDAVRRADMLSVDIQANTAPLLRQIDSINKQSRIRATAWAELETQLRNEIENSIVVNENVTKESNEWKTKFGRLDRTMKEHEAELKRLKTEVYDKNDALQKLQYQYDEALHEIKQLSATQNDMERLSKEGAARVRSEMTRTMMDNDERYRIQIESMEQALLEEQNQRSKLEVQLMGYQSYRGDNDRVHGPDIDGSKLLLAQPILTKDSENRQRLRQSQDQAEILVGALDGIGGDEYDDDDDDKNSSDDIANDSPATNNGNMNSYAALEELTSRLKASKMELSTLRTRLMESERVRNELILLIDESRIAREQLPIVEQRVYELTVENNNFQLEIQGLKEDIADVRELYRTQLNELLEAQAANPITTASVSSDGIHG